MSKGPAKKQSFKGLVEDAKGIGVSPDEVRHIQKVVKSHRFPADVHAVEVNFGRDWTGAPAAWIEFLYSSRYAKRMRAVDKIVKHLCSSAGAAR